MRKVLGILMAIAGMVTAFAIEILVEDMVKSKSSIPIVYPLTQAAGGVAVFVGSVLAFTARPKSRFFNN